MTPREFLLEFLKFHYKANPFRKQETNEKDVEDFMAELPADIEVKKFHKPLVSGSKIISAEMTQGEYDEIEWHQIHDEANEDLRNGTTVRSIDNSDLPMFDSEG